MPLYSIKGFNMKVLVTGMASSHTKPSTTTSFFGTLVEAIESFATVEWAPPSVNWTKDFLNQYDSIIVGMVPPTNIGANKVYGAMHTINLMYESPKLRLVVDEPQLWQFKSSLAAVDRNVDSLFSSFYVKRREFNVASIKDNKRSIQSAATKLLNKPWPKTIYPDMPWKSIESVSQFISPKSPYRLYGINLDSFLITEPTPSNYCSDIWVTDRADSDWAKKLQKLLSKPIYPLKSYSKEDEEMISNRLVSSYGLLVAPKDRNVGTWWSYRYIQAMNALVPVVSDWQETGKLSSSWYILGSTIEDATPEERLRIAINQRKDYLNAIPSKTEAIETLKSILSTKKVGE